MLDTVFAPIMVKVERLVRKQIDRLAEKEHTAKVGPPSDLYYETQETHCGPGNTTCRWFWNQPVHGFETQGKIR